MQIGGVIGCGPYRKYSADGICFVSILELIACALILCRERHAWAENQKIQNMNIRAGIITL